jgi:hypothetical protein
MLQNKQNCSIIFFIKLIVHIYYLTFLYFFRNNHLRIFFNIIWPSIRILIIFWNVFWSVFFIALLLLLINWLDFFLICLKVFNSSISKEKITNSTGEIFYKSSSFRNSLHWIVPIIYKFKYLIKNFIYKICFFILCIWYYFCKKIIVESAWLFQS